MKPFLKYLLVWLASAAMCLVGLFYTVLVITLPAGMVLPIGMGLGALAAAVTANRVSNSLARGRTRGRLLAVVDTTCIVGLAIGGALYAVRAYFDPGDQPARLIYFLIPSAAIVALFATAARGVLSTTEGDEERDRRVELGLVYLGVLAAIVVPLLLCSTVVYCLPV